MNPGEKVLQPPVEEVVASKIRHRYRLMVDPSRCRGCGLCELICSTVYEGECWPAASKIKVEKDRDNYQFKPLVCRQCVSPPCMTACPTGALKIEEMTAAKFIDEELCSNCGLCAEACPFASEGNTIFQHPRRNAYAKCDLCYQRDGGPACVEVCPTQALVLQKVEGDQI